jgi:hypothetical protein
MSLLVAPTLRSSATTAAEASQKPKIAKTLRFLGSVGIILRVPLKREWYPGLKDCRVLEYDTEQQVYG